MAFFQCNFFSPSLCFNTDINIFIPTPNADELLNKKNFDYFHDGSKFQVLYLLHGAYGDYTDWTRLTSIEKYAQSHKLAVVMPSASNSFYQDMHRGSAYLTYLTEELPQFVCKLFPLSQKRENTFVAGLSMGGYGAVKLAYQKPELFSACASLSGALDLVELMKNVQAGDLQGPFQWNAIFDQSTNDVKGSEADLFALIAKRKAENRPLPRIFQTCGTEDFIYPVNVRARQRLEALEVDLTYEEHTGIHDWNYWDTHIQRVLCWLPLVGHEVSE